MDIDALTDYLHAHIPLARGMGVSAVLASEETVVLKALLEPNLNHKFTAFGGSISALAILAGWALLHNRLTAEKIGCELVIRANQIDYWDAVRTDFSAAALLKHPEKWGAALHQLHRGRMARIAVTAEVESGGNACARFSGEYVAVPFG